MASLQSGQLNVYSYRNPNTTDIQNVRLFECEELRAYLVVVPPGEAIAPHVHANAHELFDVIEGEGVFVPAGAEHSLRNDGTTAWTLRVTYQDRVYPRHFGKLVKRSLRKHLP